MTATARDGAGPPVDPAPRSSRLRRKSTAAVLSLLGAGGVLLTGSRPWVTGTVHDAVLGTSTVSATGADAAPGLSALALVIAAAAIAAVSGGRVVRVGSLVVEGLSLVGVAVLVARVSVDPAGVLGPVAAASVGRTGSIEAVAHLTGWPWAATSGLVVASVGLGGAVAGMRAWSGPSPRYERPAPAGDGDQGTTSGARGQRVASAWDQLDAGLDPTDVGEDTQT